MTYENILYDVDGGIAKITMNKPDHLNPLGIDVVAELTAAFDAAEADAAVRAVILTGSGRGFSAGANLTAIDGEDIDLNDIDVAKSLDDSYNPMIRKMRRMQKPIVAAVNGVAVGAGLGLALACDMVIAGRSALFSLIFTKIGLMPDAGGTFFVSRKIGIARAMGMALTAEQISAEKAEAWGLIWQCVDDEDLMAEAETLAASFANGPTRAYGMIKKSMYAGLANSLDEQLDLESTYQGWLGKTHDFKEGVTAFVEKRAAKFEGR